MPSRVQKVQSAVQQMRASVGNAIAGKKRNPPSGEAIQYLHHDLEIPEYITRTEAYGATNASHLVEMVTYCQPIKKAARVILDAVMSSPDGSDWGVSISPTVGPEDAQVPVDTLIQLIGDRVLRETIGYETIRLMAKRAINYGDCFTEKIFMFNPQAPLIKASLSGVLVLPTFQMFRLEDNQGRLQGFEQRLSLYQAGNEIKFSPVQICHLRYDPEYLYGTSFFDGSLKDWVNFKDACLALVTASKLAVNPIKYTIPEHWEKLQKEQYIEQQQRAYKAGIIAQMFTTSDVEIERLGNGSVSSQGQIESVLYYRRALKDNTRLPSYLWNDEPVTSSARDVSGQPAMCMAVMVASIRQMISKSLREIIDTELILMGMIDPESRKYELKWPKLLATPQGLEREQEDNQDDSDKKLFMTNSYVLN